MRCLSVPLFILASVGCAGSGLPGDPCLNPLPSPECPADTVTDVGGVCESRDDCVSPGNDCTGEPVLCVPADGGPEAP